MVNHIYTLFENPPKCLNFDLFSGGNSDPSTRYIELSLMIDVSPEDQVMQEEIFGPILPIINVDSASEAIQFINNREKPLTLYVYSEDKNLHQKFMEQTSSGGLVFNECLMQMSVESLPFGGVGQSGMGAYHGKVSVFGRLSDGIPV